jgi:hypothetical protein
MEVPPVNESYVNRRPLEKLGAGELVTCRIPSSCRCQFRELYCYIGVN